MISRFFKRIYSIYEWLDLGLGAVKFVAIAIGVTGGLAVAMFGKSFFWVGPVALVAVIIALQRKVWLATRRGRNTSAEDAGRGTPHRPGAEAPDGPPPVDPNGFAARDPDGHQANEQGPGPR